MKTRILILFALMFVIPLQSFAEKTDENHESKVSRISTPMVTLYMTDKDGNILSDAKLGEQVFFKLPISNPFASTKEIDYLFFILDDGEVIYLKPDTVLLEGKTNIDVIVPWKTSSTGILDIILEQFHHNTSTHISSVFQSTINIQEIILSPLKQIKSGTALFDVRCNEEKSLVYKSDRMRAACVNGETETELINRGWALLRLGFPDYSRADYSSSLCGNYGGKWHTEHEGCRGNLSDLQCSLMGGKFVDDLKICYNGVCPEDKTYTLCVTNHDDRFEDMISSYMEKIIPSVNDFKHIVSESYGIDEIFSKFGPPHDDIGSGIHIYVYELNDLTEIWIGYTDHILYVKHVDSDGNLLEELFAENEK